MSFNKQIFQRSQYRNLHHNARIRDKGCWKQPPSRGKGVDVAGRLRLGNDCAGEGLWRAGKDGGGDRARWPTPIGSRTCPRCRWWR